MAINLKEKISCKKKEKRKIGKIEKKKKNFGTGGSFKIGKKS